VEHVVCIIAEGVNERRLTIDVGFFIFLKFLYFRFPITLGRFSNVISKPSYAYTCLLPEYNKNLPVCCCNFQLGVIN